jgi:hypothetical protein
MASFSSSRALPLKYSAAAQFMHWFVAAAVIVLLASSVAQRFGRFQAQRRTGRSSGSTRISMLRATPGVRLMRAARSRVSTI